MVGNVHELRSKGGETEKITINLGFVDLGHIDLMVQEGFYSNRTDFIRTAIRNQLDRHADVVKQSTARQSPDLGLRHYSREADRVFQLLNHSKQVVTDAKGEFRIDGAIPGHEFRLTFAKGAKNLGPAADKSPRQHLSKKAGHFL